MTDLILHKNEHYIDEDLAYYFSSQRDINNQIKPNKDIISLTLNSEHFNTDFSNQNIASLFFPIAPYSIDHIYIGISFPLFANNWGQAFLRYLMTRVNAQGSVILPVYPEIQASEKNFWSRSILENSFLSRSRWKGTSNIWAENDGVMSLRIGRKFPAEINSTASYFFEQAANTVLRRQLQSDTMQTSIEQSLFNLGQAYWHNANTFAITEQIIQDYFGMKQAVTLCEIGNSNGLLSIESLLSRYITIKQAVSFIENKQQSLATNEVSDRFHVQLADRFITCDSTASDTLNMNLNFNIICLYNTSLNDGVVEPLDQLLTIAMQQLAPGGIIIVYEQQGMTALILQLLDAYQDIDYYSAIVASQLRHDQIISHYSSAIEAELLVENEDRKNVFSVIKKRI